MMINFIKNNIQSVCLTLFVILLSVPTQVKATHIIGGDITYRYIDNNNYEITLTLRRDCQFGQVPFDPIASIGVFQKQLDGSVTLYRELRIPLMVSDTVGNTIVSNCGFIGSEVCVQRTSYRDTITLDYSELGYILSYQRCCRNESLNNVDEPLNTGTTQWIEISKSALELQNSSPTFNSWPDVYICANQPLIFDHSATDIDGDSIVYSICTPYGGGDMINNTPRPPFPPDYYEINWKAPFSLQNMMGGTALKIDPRTGQITANPNLVGQFLIGICMSEYRNGQLISTVRRDFQYNVRVCSEPVVTDFDVKNDPCDSLQIIIENKTSNADHYEWNFNYPSTDPKYLSTLETPNFKYDSAGTYTIRLIGKSNFEACDSIVFRQVTVKPGTDVPDLNLISDHIKICQGQKVPLFTTPNHGNVYVWSPVQGLDLTDPNFPYIIGNESGIYTVTVTNPNKCSNVTTITVEVNLPTLPISITGPTDICGNEVKLIAFGGNDLFEWSLTPDFNNILANTPELNTIQDVATQTYFVRSVNADCGDSAQSITVTRRNINISYDKSTSVCKGTPSQLIFINHANDQTLIYTWNDPHIVSFDNNVLVIKTIDGDNEAYTIRGTVTNQYNCSEEVIISVNVNKVDPLTFDVKLRSCDDHTMCFEINGEYNGDVLWHFGSGLTIDTSTSTNPCFTYQKGGVYTVFLTSQEKNCPFDTVKNLITVPNIGDQNVHINSTLNNCDKHEICFEIEGNYYGDITWNFGDTNTSNIQNPCHQYTTPGTYTVELTNNNPLCPFEKVSYQVVIDPIFELTPISDKVICEGEKVELAANSNDNTAVFQWLDDSGKILGTGSTLILMPMTATNITLKAVNSKGCTDSIQVKISIFKFDYTVSLSSVICPNEEYQIKINIANPENYTYEWKPSELIVLGGNTHQPLVMAQNGKEISVIITDKTTGCNETKVITPTIEAPVVYDFVGQLCNNQASDLTINVTNPDNYTYQWSPTNVIISGGNTAHPVVKATPGQELTVVVTNKITGCAEILKYTPVVLPGLTVEFDNPNIEISQGKDVIIYIKNPVSGGTYSWSNGEEGTSIQVEPTNTTTYTVTVTDTNGCTGLGTITVNVRTVSCTDKDEYLPNAFSPNGDKINDTLYVKSNVITEMTLVIYNRWGQEMFTSYKIDDGWDGKKDDQPCAPDSYAYYLRGTCINGDKFIKKGNVSILK